MWRIVIAAGVILWLAFLVCGTYSYTYRYDVAIGQHARLADDASTASKKLEYLEKYVGAVGEHITRNDARFIFKRERLTRDVQLEVLQTLVQRLGEAAKMDPQSFEYQTAMQQLTTQEFDHVLYAINGIIHACWLRQSGWLVFCLWFSWLPCGVVVLAGMAWGDARREL